MLKRDLLYKIFKRNSIQPISRKPDRNMFCYHYSYLADLNAIKDIDRPTSTCLMAYQVLTLQVTGTLQPLFNDLY